MLKLAYASLDEVPETVRGLCTAAEGSVSLDETKIKTITDVENVLKAKKMEVEAHNATKAKLAPWEKIGKSAEEVQTILDEYPELKSNSKTNEDYLNERKAHQADLRELNSLKDKLAALETANQELTSYKLKDQKARAWKVIRDELSKKYDAAKLDMIYEDLEDSLKVDEIGEFLPHKGKPVREFFEKRAEVLGWQLTNTPGKSNPGGTDRIPRNSQPSGGSMFDAETEELLDK